MNLVEGTTLAEALAFIGSSEYTLHLGPGTWPVDDDLTIPANVDLQLERGAVLSIADAKVLTINSSLKAGLYQIFSCIGTGKVLFGSGAAPLRWVEWWGLSVSVADNSAALRAALTSSTYGGFRVLMGEGTFLFTSPVFDGSAITFPNGVILQGAGSTYASISGSAKITSLSGGTIFKYTGTDKWWYLRVPSGGAGGNGKWQFRDFSVWCTEYQAHGMIFNDMTGEAGFTGASESVLNCLAFKNTSFFGGAGTAEIGSSCGNGLSICGGFALSIDNSNHFRNWKRAVWLRDCDMPVIEARILACDRYIHAETSTPTEYKSGNEGIIRGATHESYDFGETNRYQIWDNCRAYAYEDMQWEGASGNILAYLDGWWTKIRGIRLSRTSTNPTSVAKIGPNAIGVVFTDCGGRPFDPTDEPWPQMVIDDVAALYGVDDYSVYFQSCSREFMALVPTHPRVKLVGARNSRPGLAGGTTDADELYSWVGRSDSRSDSLQLNARCGLGYLRRADFYANPFTRNFVGNHLGHSEATVVADANGHLGYAIQVPYGQAAGFPFVVGRDVLLTDTLSWECRHKVDAGPTSGTYIKVHNATTSTAIVEFQVGTETAWTVKRGTINIYDYTGTVNDGDMLYVYFINKDSDKNTFLSHFSIFPTAAYVEAKAFSLKRQPIAYAASITPDLAKGSYIYCNLGTETAITINAPTNPVTGQRVLFEFLNGTDAVTITWNAVFKAAYTSVTEGKRAIVEFIYNGTNYVQVGTVQEV